MPLRCGGGGGALQPGGAAAVQLDVRQAAGLWQTPLQGGLPRRGLSPLPHRWAPHLPLRQGVAYLVIQDALPPSLPLQQGMAPLAILSLFAFLFAASEGLDLPLRQVPVFPTIPALYSGAFFWLFIDVIK